MVQFKETDYYHGAFITSMLNNGYRFSLLDDYEKRRSYLVERSNDQSVVYTKYISTARINRNGHKWIFNFTKQEIEKIMNYELPVHVALICGYGDCKTGGEFITLTMKEFLQCIGQTWATDARRITVTRKKNCQPRVYGTALVDTHSFIPRMDLISA